MIMINPNFGSGGSSRSEFWKKLNISGQDGKYCAKWLPGKRLENTNPEEGIAFNFKEGCLLLFIDNPNDTFEYIYRNVSVGEMLKKVNEALEIAELKASELEIPGLPEDALTVALNKLLFVQSDLSAAIDRDIIPESYTAFDYFQTETINPNIHPDLGGYLIAKRIVECNK